MCHLTVCLEAGALADMWAWNKEQFAAGSTDVWIFKKLTCDAVTVSFTGR